MSRLVRLVSIGMLALPGIAPADVQAFHSPSLRDDATKIVHGIRYSRSKSDTNRIDKRGHNPDYIKQLVKELEKRLGDRYNFSYEDKGAYWEYKFQMRGIKNEKESL